jgi:hypothetical protein
LTLGNVSDYPVLLFVEHPQRQKKITKPLITLAASLLLLFAVSSRRLLTTLHPFFYFFVVTVACFLACTFYRHRGELKRPTVVLRNCPESLLGTWPGVGDSGREKFDTLHHLYIGCLSVYVIMKTLPLFSTKQKFVSFSLSRSL